MTEMLVKGSTHVLTQIGLLTLTTDVHNLGTLGADPPLPGGQIVGFFRVCKQYTQDKPAGFIEGILKTYSRICPQQTRRVCAGDLYNLLGSL